MITTSKRVAVKWQTNYGEPAYSWGTWRTGVHGELAYGKLAMANWQMANQFRVKLHIPCKNSLA